MPSKGACNLSPNQQVLSPSLGCRVNPPILSTKPYTLKPKSEALDSNSILESQSQRQHDAERPAECGQRRDVGLCIRDLGFRFLGFQSV